VNLSNDINVWISALLVLAVFSVLYKENVVYRIAESVFIGVSTGYFFCLWYFSIIKPAVEDLFAGQWHLIFPIVTGILILILRNGKMSEILKIPASFLAAIFVSVTMVIYFRAYILDMVSASIMPLVVFAEDGTIRWDMTINAMVSITGTVSVLIFFVARKYPDAKMIRGYAEVGRFYILVAIGTSLGYTLFSRILIFAGRFDFLISQWLGIGFW
jgi:hypothetical protein